MRRPLDRVRAGDSASGDQPPRGPGPCGEEGRDHAPRGLSLLPVSRESCACRLWRAGVHERHRHRYEFKGLPRAAFGRATRTSNGAVGLTNAIVVLDSLFRGAGALPAPTLPMRMTAARSTSRTRCTYSSTSSRAGRSPSHPGLRRAARSPREDGLDAYRSVCMGGWRTIGGMVGSLGVSARKGGRRTRPSGSRDRR